LESFPTFLAQYVAAEAANEADEQSLSTGLQ